jgi:hypothetical protein
MKTADWLSPHPYDCLRGIRFSASKLPIDALQVFSTATTLRRYNRYAFKYAGPRFAHDGGKRRAPSPVGRPTIPNTEFLRRGILARS